MKKELLVCDQCHKEFAVGDLRCTKEDGPRLKFLVTDLRKDTVVYKFDICSHQCLEDLARELPEKA